MQPINDRHYALLESFMNDPNITRMRERHRTQRFHYAMLVLRGKIVSMASNDYGTPSRGGCGYGKWCTIHAEKNCIKKVGDLSKLKGCDLYVMKIREHAITNEMYFSNSKPCRSCTLFLEKCQRNFGLKNVFYTSMPEGVNSQGVSSQ